MESPIGSITPAHHGSFHVLGGGGVLGVWEDGEISDGKLRRRDQSGKDQHIQILFFVSLASPLASTHQKKEWITGKRTSCVEESKGSNEEKIGLHDFE